MSAAVQDVLTQQKWVLISGTQRKLSLPSINLHILRCSNCTINLYVNMIVHNLPQSLRGRLCSCSPSTEDKTLDRKGVSFKKMAMQSESIIQEKETSGISCGPPQIISVIFFEAFFDSTLKCRACTDNGLMLPQEHSLNSCMYTVSCKNTLLLKR